MDCDQKDAEVVLSKSQQKKQLRRQKYLEHRGERRKLEREKRKTKKVEQAKQRLEAAACGQMIPEIITKKTTLMKDSCNKFKVVIDMDFEEFMTDAEMSKATQQLGRIYSLNRHADNPCQLYVTSLKGKILDKFQYTNSGYKSWDINHTELDYQQLFTSSNTDQSEQNIVYLSGDAEDTLPDVEALLKDDSKIFVIGGLVDHNRHKNLCQTRAHSRNIPTAKLPLKENITLCQRHILSTVAVFEILLHVLSSHKSWREALIMSVPKRKIVQECKDSD